MVDVRPVATSGCLDDATVAAFVDGTLAPAERERVEAHVASCDDCYVLVTEVARAEETLPQSDAEATVPFWKRRAGLLAGGLSLAAAAAVIVMLMPSPRTLQPLVDAVGAQRLTQARPTGGFQYGPLRPVLRSAEAADDVARTRVQTEVARLRDDASSGDPRDLHAYGIGQLLAGDVVESVDTLEEAARARASDAAIHADLGAARFTRSVRLGDTESLTAALDAIDRAIAIDPKLPEAWFNRALTLEVMGRGGDAVAAWTTYLELDAESAWSHEARRRRDALR